MTRVKLSEWGKACGTLRVELVAAGIIGPADTVEVQQGSRANGRAFRLYLYAPGSGAQQAVPGIDTYLGQTGPEAWRILWAVIHALRAARYAGERRA